MNLRDLKYLVEVMETLSFSKAAKKCSISQPTLSMQLKKLEEYLGVKFFERTNKKVLPTAEGKKIYELAKSITQKSEEIQSFAKTSQDIFSGELRLGGFPTLAPYLFPKIIPKISTNFPKLKLLLIEEKTEKLTHMLESGEIDAAFMATPVYNQLFTHQNIFDDRFLLAVNKLHPLSSKKIISNHDLAKEKLLLLDEGHCLREQALEFCHIAKTSEKDSFRATSLETLRQMVSINIGITLIPQIAVEPNKSTNITYIKFKEPAPYRSIALFWRKTSIKTELLEQISAIAKEFT